MKKYIKHNIVEDWGEACVFIREDGASFARAYWFNDDKDTLFLDSLSVSPEKRKQGIGLDLQLIREEMAICLQFKNTALWVKQHTWQYEWYKRRGYVFDKQHEEDGCVWMVKDVNA